jgi:hypothetical protein
VSAKQPKRKQPAPKSPKREGKIEKPKGKPHRIQPGERLPGAGRPLGSKSLKGAFEAVASLDFGLVTFPGGVTRRLTGTEKVAKRVYDAAKKGNLRAADMFFDRMHGKVPLPVKNMGSGNESKLRVIFDRGSLDPKPLPNEEGSDGKHEEDKDE